MPKTLALLGLLLCSCSSIKSKPPVSYPNFKVELGLSLIEHHYITTAPIQSEDYSFMDGICGELHLVYNFKEGHAFSMGINFYDHLPTFSIANEDEQYFYTYSTNILALPFTYTIDKRINRKILSFLEGGLSLNFPIQNYYSSNEVNDIGSFDNGIITIYKPQGIPTTAILKLGLKIPSKKSNFFKVSAVASIPLNPSTLVQYESTTNASYYSEKGAVSSSFGYYGFSLNYAFTLRSIGKSLRNFKDNTNDFFDK